MALVTQELREGVAWLRLNDPGRLNAMTEPMAREFEQTVRGLQAAQLRAVVLQGSGGNFSAGGDLGMLEAKHSLSWETNKEQMLDFYHAFHSLLALEVPLLAAVEGWAVGAGCCLAALCDLRLGDPGARFRVPFLQMGLFPGMGTTHWLPRRLGPWAAEFLLTGATYTAEQALARGLLTDIAPAGQLEEHAQRTVKRLLANGPEATRDLLRVLRGPNATWEQALRQEADLQARSYNRPEFAEGLARARARNKS